MLTDYCLPITDYSPLRSQERDANSLGRQIAIGGVLASGPVGIGQDEVHAPFAGERGVANPCLAIAPFQQRVARRWRKQAVGNKGDLASVGREDGGDERLRPHKRRGTRPRRERSLCGSRGRQPSERVMEHNGHRIITIFDLRFTNGDSRVGGGREDDFGRRMGLVISDQ